MSYRPARLAIAAVLALGIAASVPAAAHAAPVKQPKLLTTAQAAAATGYTGVLDAFDIGCTSDTPPLCVHMWTPAAAPGDKPLGPTMIAVTAYPNPKTAKAALARKTQISPGWGPDQIVSARPTEVIRMQVPPLNPPANAGYPYIVELYTLKGRYLVQANCQPAGWDPSGTDAALACARQLTAAQKALLR